MFFGPHVVVKDDGVTAVLKDTGQTIKLDQTVCTAGLSSQHRSVSIDNAPMDRGFLDTDDMLVVAGSNDKVLGYGDRCITLRNSGSELVRNMSIVGNNMKAGLDGKTKAMKKAKPDQVMAIVTVGPKVGVAQTPMFKTQFIFSGRKNPRIGVGVLLCTDEPTSISSGVDRQRKLY